LRPDEEVGQDACPGATLGSIFLKRPSGQEQRGTRHLVDLDTRSIEKSVDVVRAIKADRQLGVDDRIHQQPVEQSVSLELAK
jgi:hypothetical protein